jgi:hypothetical protein
MKDKYSDIVKKLRSKGYSTKDIIHDKMYWYGIYVYNKMYGMYGVEPSDTLGRIKLYNPDTKEWTIQSYLTIILYNIIVDDVFYNDRMLYNFPSTYYTINRKVIDDSYSVVFINKKFNINEEEALEALEFWAESLPSLDKEIRKYIDSLGCKYEDEAGIELD